MEHGHDGLNAVFQALINQVIVKGDSLRVDCPSTCWQNTGPRDGEAVRFEAHFSHQGDVFLVAVVVVNRDRKVRSSFWNLFDILTGWTLAIFQGSSLNLVG